MRPRPRVVNVETWWGHTPETTVIDGFWRWRAKGKNHEIIASGEAYYNKADCLHAINLLRGSSSAPVYEE